MKMTLKEAYDSIQKSIDVSDQAMMDAQAIADEYGLSFWYRPVGTGTYKGTLTVQKALDFISTNEYPNLSYEDQERVDEVIAENEDEDNEYSESWQSSFC